MEITVQEGASVADKKAELLAAWWESAEPAKPARKPKASKPPKAPKSVPAPAPEVSNMDTKTPEEAQAEHDMLTKILAKPFYLLGRRYTRNHGLKEYTEPEATDLADASVDVIQKYAPELSEYAPEIRLALTLGSQVMDRVTGEEEGQDVTALNP